MECSNNQLFAGYAEVDYTPGPGLWLKGQQFARQATRARDPLMALGAAHRYGDETVVMVAIDSVCLSKDLVERAQDRFEKRTGLPGRRLIVSATHSHVAPALLADRWCEVDPDFVERLANAVVHAAVEAIQHIEPVSAYSGAGQLEHLGWNRRTMFADGTSAMHGCTNRPDFIGMEGPRDPNLSVLFTRSAHAKITGAIVSFATHPNSVESECYYSADIPGEVRRLLKLMLGQDVVIIYLTGAAGNVTPVIREPHTPVQPWMGEDGLLRSGLYLAGEASKVIASAIERVESPVVRLEQTTLAIPMRPFPEIGSRNYPDFWSDESKEHYAVQEADWPRRMKEESPVEVRVNVIRIGDTVICTNPAELFVEFGLAIREASPARVTILSELTDGYAGYIPTPLAFSRGGYETWPACSSRLVPEAGDQIVQATKELLKKVF